jgi:hypothetical protein
MVSKELDGDCKDHVAGVVHGLKKEMVELLLTEAKMVDAKLARGLMEKIEVMVGVAGEVEYE